MFLQTPYVYGLLLGILPIIWWFLKKDQQKKKIISSIFLWQQVIKELNDSKLTKVKKWVQLLMQIAIVLLIVGALVSIGEKDPPLLSTEAIKLVEIHNTNLQKTCMPRILLVGNSPFIEKALQSMRTITYEKADTLLEGYEGYIIADKLQEDAKVWGKNIWYLSPKEKQQSLVEYQENNGGRSVSCKMELEKSDLPKNPYFPIMVEEVVDYLVGDRDLLQKKVIPKRLDGKQAQIVETSLLKVLIISGAISLLLIEEKVNKDAT